MIRQKTEDLLYFYWLLLQVSLRQGRIYVANENDAFVRIMLIVCHKLRALKKFLNSRKNLFGFMKNMQIFG